jgi:hypothetical protein
MFVASPVPHQVMSDARSGGGDAARISGTERAPERSIRLAALAVGCVSYLDAA